MDGGFRLYSQNDVGRVEQIKRLQNLLGLTLAEIKDMVELEEVQEELNATYRPDLDIAERIERVSKRILITRQQSDIISAKLIAMDEMKKEVDEKLERFKTRLSDLEKRRDEVASSATG